jgi:hypothetical protein
MNQALKHFRAVVRRKKQLDAMVLRQHCRRGALYD